MVCCCHPYENLEPERDKASFSHDGTDRSKRITEELVLMETVSETESISVAKSDSTPDPERTVHLNEVDAGTPSTPVLSRNSPVKESGETGGLVSVTIPPGVFPGQVIQVNSLYGKQKVHATVPEGLQPGQTFLVSMVPPKVPITPARPAPTPETKLIRTDKKYGSNGETNSNPRGKSETKLIRPEKKSKSKEETKSNPRLSEDPNKRSTKQEQRQKMLLVDVPDGMPRGSRIYVEIPGEDRTLAAQVPPNVTSFYMVYTPRSKQQHGVNAMPPRPTPTPPIVPSQEPNTLEKLLLVRVPKGILPGTTLHVSVPDEKGRILAAQVPPGDVKEFHVAYTPHSVQSEAAPEAAYTI